MKSIDSYIKNLPENQQDIFLSYINSLEQNMPEGFITCISYGMPCIAVPHSIYKAGYHCKPDEPLPLVSLAARKDFIAVYHMGLYADTDLMNWFLAEWPKYIKRKPDIGKSCIRFKYSDSVPHSLLVDLIKKLTPKQWIKIYESKFRK